MTEKQIELARHALGLPNAKNESYRNHFCTERNDKEWSAMVEQGDAVMRESQLLDDDHVFFHLTLQGALAARGPKEHISREDAEVMRRISEKVA
jgi:hypothetical protein